MYAIPSHNHQAFYLQIYVGDNYTLLYAKTRITDFLGNAIAMYTFKDSLKSDVHKAKTGDIYCGMKHISLDNMIIKKLLECLPTKNEICIDDNVILDGVCTIIGNYQSIPPSVVAYYDSCQIKQNKISHEQAEFMNDLYLYIEQIIGNLLA